MQKINIETKQTTDVTGKIVRLAGQTCTGVTHAAAGMLLNSVLPPSEGGDPPIKAVFFACDDREDTIYRHILRQSGIQFKEDDSTSQLYSQVRSLGIFVQAVTSQVDLLIEYIDGMRQKPSVQHLVVDGLNLYPQDHDHFWNAVRKWRSEMEGIVVITQRLPRGASAIADQRDVVVFQTERNDSDFTLRVVKATA